MYQHTDFDRQVIRERADQYANQLERHLAGQLGELEFKPLRLQNGWYVQRHAPMLRVAVPYGALSAEQARALADVAEQFDQPDAQAYAQANAQQAAISDFPAPQLAYGVAHFTTRQNVQFNWIPLARSAEVMHRLAQVGLHGIQTSGNCIRNTTSDALAGIAPDEVADPRPFAELIRQWSTVHPEFAFLPRKFKVAIHGATEDRAATLWHDVGLRLIRNSAGELGFEVHVGGGMGRTPVVAPLVRAFLPWADLLNYLEAVLRTYNRWGRRDNAYKARIKILVKAEFERFTQEVEAEFTRIVENDGAPHRLTQADWQAVQARFSPDPAPLVETDLPTAGLTPAEQAAFSRWLSRQVQAHRLTGYRAVQLSFKRVGLAPGDARPEHLRGAAELADRFSRGELRVTHNQNLVLPWVPQADLVTVWQAARALGLASPNAGLLTDLIACPGGDFCSLANARSLPLAAAIADRFSDLDELWDLGAIDLHVSGCINSCGHHHSGHLGILGVDKDGQEWYQVTLGGSDGRHASGPTRAGKVIGPSFAAAEVVPVIEAVLDTYRQQRESGESFVHCVHRLGLDPFKQAAHAVRTTTASPSEANSHA